MIGRILGYAVAFALPGFLAAQTPQIPNEHASAQAALHSQGAQHRATHRRGKVVHAEDVDHDRDDRTKTEDTDHDRDDRSEEHTSELQSRLHLVCRLLLEKKKESNGGSKAHCSVWAPVH